MFVLLLPAWCFSPQYLQHKTDYDICSACLRPKANSGVASLAEMQRQAETQREVEKEKRKRERRRVKQCEELWIRRSEIRPFNCICALFSFITMLTLVLRRMKSSFTSQPITKQKLLLFETFNWFIKVIQTKFLRLLSLTLKRFFCITSSCCSATFQRNKAAQTHNTWKGFQFIGTQHIKWN